MKGLENPVVIEFPLRGEWLAPNTPGKRIPSHGTDQLGERYAFDFLQVDWSRSGLPPYKTSLLQYLIFGVPLKNCYCWGKKVYAPCDGEIVNIEDGFKERARVHLVSDLFAVLKNAFTFNPEKNGIQSVAGNYVIMKCNNDVFAAFAHLQTDSIAVSVGQTVKKGDVLGKVGHSGNSTSPHLHFQLMDNSKILTAKGIPCVFEQYQIFQDGEWKTVHEEIPSDRDRIRFNPL
jgi:murein DD-endopeptidase MepM/ murein hydrolase activator NlpD